jgi:hypothetical protein
MGGFPPLGYLMMGWRGDVVGYCTEYGVFSATGWLIVEWRGVVVGYCTEYGVFSATGVSQCGVVRGGGGLLH